MNRKTHDRSGLSICPGLSCGAWMWLARWCKCTASRACIYGYDVKNKNTIFQTMENMHSIMFIQSIFNLYLLLSSLYIGFFRLSALRSYDLVISAPSQAILEADQWSLSPWSGDPICESICWTSKIVEHMWPWGILWLIRVPGCTICYTNMYIYIYILYQAKFQTHQYGPVRTCMKHVYGSQRAMPTWTDGTW